MLQRLGGYRGAFIVILQLIVFGIIYLLVSDHFTLDLGDQTSTRSDLSENLILSRNNSVIVKIKMSHSTSTVAQQTVSTKRTQGSVRPKTFLLIMVSLQPASFVARDTIRNTWYRGFRDSEDVIMRFVVGTKEVKQDVMGRLQNESDTHKDLVIMENVKEYHKTSTNKTLSMMVWAHNNVDFKYLMKSELATFIHVRNMVNVLRQRPTTKGLYYGKMQYKVSPIRKESERQDKTWDLAATYLPYALGRGYILSSDLVRLMVLRRNYLAYHPNEDTAVASWIVAYHYERRDDELFCVTPLSKNNQLEGKCKSNIIAQICDGIKEEDLEKWFTKIEG